MKKKLSALSEVSKAMEQVLDRSSVNELAKSSGFITRQRSSLRGLEFLQMLVFESLGSIGSLTGMIFSLKKLIPSLSLSPQALSKRLPNDRTVSFLRKSFLRVFERHQQIEVEKLSPSLLAPFSQVLTEDSSICTLHPSLSSDFAGCQGKGSKASVKLHFIHELKQSKPLCLDLTEGKASDAGHGKKIFDFLQPKGLVIRDLGYFALTFFKTIQEEFQAFFLSRYKTNTLLYRNSDDQEPLDLGCWLSQLPENQRVVDTHFYLGAQKFYSRWVAYRLPPKIADHRKRTAHRNAQREGRTLTKEQKKSWSFPCALLTFLRPFGRLRSLEPFIGSGGNKNSPSNAGNPT